MELNRTKSYTFSVASKSRAEMLIESLNLYIRIWLVSVYP